MSRDDELRGMVEKALDRAFSLGQTYWEQADSEYASQWKKADETRKKFNDLCNETAALLTRTEAAPVADGAVHPLWLLYCGDQFINSMKRLPGENDDAGLKGFLRGAVRSLKEAKRQGYRVVRGFAAPLWHQDAQRRWEFVRTHGKLPVRCSAGYYYEDGVLHPTAEAAIDAAMSAAAREQTP